jgi:phosphopantothenoylcysteine decarboxylase
MAQVLLGVTGSVAAIRTPELHAALRRAGHAVKIVATRSAEYFFDPAAIEPIPGGRNREVVYLDADEWPDRDAGRRWERGDPVLHIELRKWADLLLIAPLDANTLAKLALGLSDNFLTCVYRAWDFARPIVLAPAMNTLMWENPITGRHLTALIADHNRGRFKGRAELGDPEELIKRINEFCPKLHVVPPISKALACGDVGVGAMAEVPAVAAAVERMLR